MTEFFVSILTVNRTEVFLNSFIIEASTEELAYKNAVQKIEEETGKIAQVRMKTIIEIPKNEDSSNVPQLLKTS